MPERVGELPEGAKPLKYDPRRGCGKISLRIGEESKVVQHVADGPADQPFVRLAKDLLDNTIEKSKSGVGADSLADGLQKVLDNRIDARAMKLEVGCLRHQFCYTLNVEGLSSSISGQETLFKRFKGKRELRTEELHGFIKKLQELKVQELSRNVQTKYDILLNVDLRVLDKQHYSGGFGYAFDAKAVLRKARMPPIQSVWNASIALEPTREVEKK